ncbi:MAG: hydantoinase/oxoprolinase family protein [Chloroflexi bacterium]|nr:hydantoinase/oxoprolinase family protein [Chloroflexota bacterium]
MYWIGFDVGGTFVDLFAYETGTGRFCTLKVPSSRQHLAATVAAGIRRLLDENGISLDLVKRIAHGTTVVTNQLVEGKGARVGVLTTAGFRDVLEIGRMRRRSLYDLYLDKVPPLAARDLRLEVVERITAAGQVQTPLDPAEARSVLAELRRRGAEVVAICLLNSYANPVHEELLGELCREVGLPCSLSARVTAEYGEFERWSTAAVNSSVMPQAAGYLRGLAGAVGEMGIACPLEIMQSNGGVIPVAVAAAFPVRLVESGPAAGVAGATILAGQAGCHNLITLDMGGTSTDVSLVVGGRPTYGSEYTVAGYPVRTVGIDIRSIGAGGGSLALLDRMGALQVGPESAGSEPGPACYGSGGGTPTVTDADLVLGYLNPLRFCGGERPLDVAAAQLAIERGVAGPMGVGVEDAALGILDVATANMVGAVRKITTERGYDPRDFTLVAFGGAGPVHAGLIARELNIPEVLILNQPGLLSAKGLLLSDYRTDAYRTFVGRLAELDPAAPDAAFAQLVAQGMAQLAGARDQVAGFSLTRILEMCYEGQQHIIPIVVEERPLQSEHLAAVAAELDRRFQEVHGFLPQSRVPQVLRLRVSVEGVVPRSMPQQGAVAGQAAEPIGWREAFFRDGGPKRHRVPVYDRETLPSGPALPGPCIVEEAYSTTVVYPGQVAQVDTLGNIHIIASLVTRHASLRHPSSVMTSDA